MKNLLLTLFGLIVFGGAPSSSADQVNVSGDPVKTVTLSGVWGGVSSELYEILELSGATHVSLSRGEAFQGKALSALISREDPTSQFEVTLQIDADSAVNIEGSGDSPAYSSSVLAIDGDAAAELYSDMAKAGLPKALDVDGNTLKGANVSCTQLVSGHAHYNCRLRAS
jgi:hypothetical protein